VSSRVALAKVRLDPATVPRPTNVNDGALEVTGAEFVVIVTVPASKEAPGVSVTWSAPVRVVTVSVSPVLVP